MNKRQMTEADIRSKFITPAILGAKGEKADYILYYKPNLPLAVLLELGLVVKTNSGYKANIDILRTQAPVSTGKIE
jgi:hypothetical protein